MNLRPYQQASCDAAWGYLCSQPGNPVIVLPTGAGKSIVIAELARRAVVDFGGRVIVLAHRRELLEQNAAKLKSLLPLGVTCGLYSAGLRRSATDDHVIVAGIQSVHRKADLFGARHLVLVDEVHLCPVSGEGTYRTFLNDLREINPRLRLIGLTATPYRTDCGALCRPDGLFQAICYSASIPALIADGYLSPITNQPAATSYDTSGLHVRGGEFITREMEALFEAQDKTAVACREIQAATADRRSVLVFAASVAHAEHVAKLLDAGLITGQTPPLERSATIEAFRDGRLRMLVNVDVLTTGFDAPGIDAIAILRATMSPGLFAQMVGRGLRVAPGKADALILDFGENIKRHGPIDAIDYGRPRIPPAGERDGPIKTCPNCSEEVAAGRRECECGFRFPPPQLKHDETADTASAVLAEPEIWIVEEVHMARHRKRKAEPGDPDTLRVDYTCRRGGNIEETISEWICLEHPPGFALRKAHLWWQAHSLAPIPGGIDEALDLWKRGALAAPTRITAIRKGRFFTIVTQDLDERPETWADEAVEDLFADVSW